MFICEHTGELIGPGIPENKVVVERRKKVYEKKIYKGRIKKKLVGVELVEGWEIVKEISVGPKAYQELTGKTPRITQNSSKLKPPQKPKPPKFKAAARKKKEWKNPKGTNSKGPRSKQKPIVQKVNPIKNQKQ